MDADTILGIVLLIVGALAAVSEIHTLTIYLLAVAVGCFAAAGVALAGGGLTLSLIVLGVVILLGMPLAHWFRKRLKNRDADRVSSDDVGRDVTVIDTHGGRLRVSYRGSTWDARLKGDPAILPAVGQTYSIVAREGNVLVIAPVSNVAA